MSAPSQIAREAAERILKNAGNSLCERSAAETIQSAMDMAAADKARMDWLEQEGELEQQQIKAIGHIQFSALFRRNVPITRAAIDALRTKARPSARL